MKADVKEEGKKKEEKRKKKKENRKKIKDKKEGFIYLFAWLLACLFVGLQLNADEF